MEEIIVWYTSNYKVGDLITIQGKSYRIVEATREGQALKLKIEME